MVTAVELNQSFGSACIRFLSVLGERVGVYRREVSWKRGG